MVEADNLVVEVRFSHFPLVTDKNACLGAVLRASADVRVFRWLKCPVTQQASYFRLRVGEQNAAKASKATAKALGFPHSTRQ